MFIKHPRVRSIGSISSYIPLEKELKYIGILPIKKVGEVFRTILFSLLCFMWVTGKRGTF